MRLIESSNLHRDDDQHDGEKIDSRLHSGRTLGLHEPSAWQYLPNHQDHHDDINDNMMTLMIRFIETDQFAS